MPCDFGILLTEALVPHIHQTDDLAVIAAEIASLPKQNKFRPRIVIITHGADPTIVVSSDAPTSPKIYPIIPVATADIVDTNGAGDSFAGGFLGALVLGKSLDEAIEGGHRLGAMCIRQVCAHGRSLAFPLTYNFADWRSAQMA